MSGALGGFEGQCIFIADLSFFDFDFDVLYFVIVIVIVVIVVTVVRYIHTSIDHRSRSCLVLSNINLFASLRGFSTCYNRLQETTC